MKALFLNPPRLNGACVMTDPVLTRCSGVPAKAPYLWPPIGLAYLAAYARENSNAEISMLDAQAEDLDLQETAKRASGYDIVFVNAGTSSIERDLELCRAIKENGEAKTAIIGPHANYFHSELARENGVDFALRGELENSITGLLGALEKKSPLKKVKGISWKEKGRVISTEKAELMKDLDALPFAARELLPYEKYYDILTKGKKTDLLISSRGCPFHCGFCSSGAIAGHTYRPRSPKNVLNEVDEIIGRGRDDLLFFDDTFTIDRKRVEKICEGLKKTGIEWRCLSRVDTVDKKLLEKMKESGCYQVQFGVESGSQKMLDAMKKGHSLKQAKETFEACNRLGIETVAFFVFGFPGETIESLEKTVAFAKSLDADFASFNIFTPLPGAEAFEKFAGGKKDWEKFDFTSASFCDIPTKTLVDAKNRAYRQFYIKPSYLWNRVKKTGFRRTVSQNLKFWLLRRGVLWNSIRAK
jgi:anaerobic magnesium-protoporphyrin IX monomethyl ester cyclase